MKPIIFSTPMVQAILDSRKTQTRRVIKPNIIEKGTNWFWNPNENVNLAPYKPGDILWVRETFCEVPYEHNHVPIKGGYITIPKYAYKADSERDYTGIWKPSIHMPREAARIFLRVTNVRVERLRDITETDVRKEGFSDHFDIETDTFYPCGYFFKHTWNNLNAKRGYGWDTSPWVWVIEFEKISKEGLK